MKNYKFVKYALVILLMAISTVFCACEPLFGNSSKVLKVAGAISFEQQALNDVTIKSKTQSYCLTDANGQFNFEAKTESVTIYAEKAGYTFTPRSITLTESNENIVFVAEVVKNLDGFISLSSINIVPTSIASFSETYKYIINETENIKIKSLDISIGDVTYENCLDYNPIYAAKGKNNYLNFSTYNSMRTGSKVSVSFKLSVYFKIGTSEYIFNEDRPTILIIPEKQTTELLNDQGKMVLSLFGINSTNNKFTYNISFIFNYEPN